MSLDVISNPVFVNTNATVKIIPHSLREEVYLNQPIIGTEDIETPEGECPSSAFLVSGGRAFCYLHRGHRGLCCDHVYAISWGDIANWIYDIKEE